MAAVPRAFYQQDLWHYTVGKMVDACLAYGLKPFYGPFGDFSDLAACEAQFRNAFLQGCLGAWSLAPDADRDRETRIFARPGRGQVRQAHPRCHAGRHRRRHARRQDAGRRDLEAGEGHRRSGKNRCVEGSGARGSLRRSIVRIHSYGDGLATFASAATHSRS